MHHARFLVSVALVCLALTACSQPQSELVVTADGCLTEHVRLPPSHEPVISVENRADTAMVVTIPTMNQWVVVHPDAEAQLELPRYIMGSFDFFCLEEAEHTRIGGGNPYLCAMEPDDVAPVALSQGIFEIEPHERIKELTGG